MAGLTSLNDPYGGGGWDGAGMPHGGLQSLNQNTMAGAAPGRAGGAPRPGSDKFNDTINQRQQQATQELFARAGQRLPMGQNDLTNAATNLAHNSGLMMNQQQPPPPPAGGPGQPHPPGMPGTPGMPGMPGSPGMPGMPPPVPGTLAGQVMTPQMQATAASMANPMSQPMMPPAHNAPMGAMPGGAPGGYADGGYVQRFDDGGMPEPPPLPGAAGAAAGSGVGAPPAPGAPSAPAAPGHDRFNQIMQLYRMTNQAQRPGGVGAAGYAGAGYADGGYARGGTTGGGGNAFPSAGVAHAPPFVAGNPTYHNLPAGPPIPVSNAPISRAPQMQGFQTPNYAGAVYQPRSGLPGEAAYLQNQGIEFTGQPEQKYNFPVVRIKDGGLASLAKKVGMKDLLDRPRQDFAGGGPVNDPWAAGRRDTVPARLDDGEFVMTKKAVQGAGLGDAALGAARMYQHMRSLENMSPHQLPFVSKRYG